MNHRSVRVCSGLLSTRHTELSYIESRRRDKHVRQVLALVNDVAIVHFGEAEILQDSEHLLNLKVLIVDNFA